MMKTKPRLILMVSLWLKSDNVTDFEVYERLAAQVLKKHGGRIERVVRVKEQRGDDGDAPFEIHIVSFPNEQSYADYQADSETRKLSELRNESIARTEIRLGYEMKSYAAS